MVHELYRKMIPEKIRIVIYQHLSRHLRKFFTLLKCKWYSLIPFLNEKGMAYKAMGIVGISPYPYLWKREYEKRHYEVRTDTDTKLPYVIHNGKRLYFCRNMSMNLVETLYRSLLIEQDRRSPHRYEDDYEELKGKTLLDIGSAEGIFTLDTIEYVNHAYLFECDEAWIEALEATFAAWKEKITIVRKYVSDVDDVDNVTLDTYFKNKLPNNLFLKMDIEGEERKALKGAGDLLKLSKQISGSVCIYHKESDEHVMKNILTSHNLKWAVSPGYLFFEWMMRPAIIRFNRVS